LLVLLEVRMIALLTSSYTHLQIIVKTLSYHAWAFL
jgi:hypothetical protein